MGTVGHSYPVGSLRRWQLRRLLLDDSHVHAAVVAYPTWAELRHAGRTDLGHVLGAAGVGVHLPDVPYTGLDLIDGYTPITRYSIDYPRNVLDLRTPPVLFYVRGTIPDGVAVAIVGSQYPTPEAVEVARNSATAAGGLNQIVVANMSNTVGNAALSTAVEVRPRHRRAGPFTGTTEHQPTAHRHRPLPRRCSPVSGSARSATV